MQNVVAPRVVREQEGTPFSVSDALQVQDLINEHGFPFSVARVTVTGQNEPTINPYCDTTYYVLEGRGHFTIAGQEYDVEAGNLIIIPKETPYQGRGEPTLGLLAISSPRFPGNLD